MFVPFIIDFSPDIEARYLGEFYRSLTVAKQYGWPIIAQKEYFYSPEYYAKVGRPEPVDKQWASVIEYDFPTDEDLKKINQYPFPEEILEQLIDEQHSQSNACVFLFKNSHAPFENWISQILDDISDSYNEPIEAIIALRYYPSLDSAARKRKIPIIYYDMGAFRPTAYRNTAYIDFKGFLDNTSCEERYSEFCKEKENNYCDILSRKEILSLFLSPEYMSSITLLDKEPEYEMGVATQSTLFYYSLANTYQNNLDLISEAKKVYPDQRLLLRVHPGDSCQAKYDRFFSNIDPSPVPLMFISKCKRVASVTSNVCFEAMLWGKIAYSIGENQYSSQALRKLSDKSETIADLEFINFITFCFYIPYEFLKDMDYLRWRLTKPSELEIYNRHLKYYLECRGVDRELLNTTHSERVYRIMEAQGFNALGEPLKDQSQTEEWIEILKKAEKLAGKDKRIQYLLNRIQFLESFNKAQHESQTSAVKHEKMLMDKDVYIKELEGNLNWHADKVQELNIAVEQYQGHEKNTTELIEQKDKYIQELEGNLNWHANKVQELIKSVEQNQSEGRQLTEIVTQKDSYITELEFNLNQHANKVQEMNGQLETYLKLDEEKNDIVAKKTAYIAELEANTVHKEEMEKIRLETLKLRQTLFDIEQSTFWKMFKFFRKS